MLEYQMDRLRKILPTLYSEKGRLFLYSLLIAIVFGLRPINTVDIWWHLKTGAWTLAHLEIPRTDIFSYTVYGKPWVHHEWLGSVILWLLFYIAGFKGLIITEVLLFASFLYLAGRSAQSLCQTKTIPFVMIFCLAFLSYFRVMPRPHLFGNLFMALLLATLYSSVVRKKKTSFQLWGLPILFILWANVHAGVLIGLLVLFLFFLGTSVSESLEAKKIKVPFRLFLITGACFLAVLINPYFFRVYTFPFDHWGMNAILANTKEFFPPYHEDLKSYLIVQGYFFLFFVTIIALFIHGRKLCLPVFLTGLPLTFLSFKYIRFADLFALWALPFVSAQFQGASILKNIPGAFFCKVVKPFMKVIVFTALLLIVWKGIPQKLTGGGGPWSHLAFGLAPGISQEGVVDFLERNNIRERIFNTFEMGSFLISMNYPVFIDGRTPVYGDDFFKQYQQALENPDVFEQLAQKWNFGVLLLSRYLEVGMAELHLYLMNNPRWELVYVDESAYIYLERREPLLSVIEKNKMSKSVILEILQSNSDFHLLNLK